MHAEFDDVVAFFGMFGVVDGFHLFHLSFGIVGDDELHGVQYGGYAGGAVIQVLAHGAFQQGEFIKVNIMYLSKVMVIHPLACIHGSYAYEKG